MNVFFDTNILLDVLAERLPFYKHSVGAWSLAEAGRITGAVSAITLANLYYILRKWADDKTARRGVRLARSVFDVVACDKQIIDEALAADLPDFEDAIQMFSALRAGSKCILTRNPHHFEKSSLIVLAPAEFLDVYPQL